MPALGTRAQGQWAHNDMLRSVFIGFFRGNFRTFDEFTNVLTDPTKLEELLNMVSAHFIADQSNNQATRSSFGLQQVDTPYSGIQSLEPPPGVSDAIAKKLNATSIPHLAHLVNTVPFTPLDIEFPSGIPVLVVQLSVR